MKEASTAHKALILHLSGGGDLSGEISRQLAQANLRAEVFADPYVAMGWLAGLRPARAKAAVVDHSCLTDEVRDFPRLALGLTTTGSVYLYGDRAALASDPAITRGGVRTVGTGQQVSLMVAELERLVGRPPQVGEGPAPQEAARPGAVSPVGGADRGIGQQVLGVGATAGPGESPGEPSGEAPAGSPPEQGVDDSGPSELRVVEPASGNVDTEADALAEATSQPWPRPVLEVVEADEEPLARILPDADREESLDEVPTPWSPSTRRPERTPPKVDDAKEERQPAPREPSAAEPNQPILTPEELEALLGRQDQA